MKNANQDFKNQSFDLASLKSLFILLHGSRWFILATTLLIFFAGTLGTFLSASYTSEGFFQFGGPIPSVSISERNKKLSKELRKEKDKLFDREGEQNKSRDDETEISPGITLANYKRFAAAFATPERFSEYIKEKELGSTTAAKNLHSVFHSSQGLLKIIEPVYPFTKLDAKVLGDQPKGSINNVIGLRFACSGRTAEEAQKMVDLLGHYAMDSIIYLIYSDELQFKQSEIASKMATIDNEIIKHRSNLEGYKQKKADLKIIRAQYPNTLKGSSSPVIAINDENAHYLSPTLQLTALDVRTFEEAESIRKAQREQRKGALLLEYYNHAKTLLDSTSSGETVLRRLPAIKENVFKGKNMRDEVVQEVYNMITADTQNATNIYLEKSRFIAGPTLPAKSSAKPVLAAAISLVVGLIVSVFLVIARKWWQENYNRIT